MKQLAKVCFYLNLFHKSRATGRIIQVVSHESINEYLTILTSNTVKQGGKLTRGRGRQPGAGRQGRGRSDPLKGTQERAVGVQPVWESPTERKNNKTLSHDTLLRPL